MRIPLLLRTALIGIPVSVFIFFGFRYYPGVLTILGLIFMLTVFFFILRANLSAFSFSKNPVASGIYEIHMDLNEIDFHVFSYHTSSRSKSGLPPLRFVQHHFFKAYDGEHFYSELFSHDLHAKKAATGYEDFETFEKSVLTSEELKESLETFSKKADKVLGIGRKLAGDPDGALYPIEEGLAIKIEKDESGILTRYSVLFMNSNTEDVLWRKKI